MKIFASIKESIINHIKMLTLSDIRPYLTKRQLIKIIITMILNIWNSAAKILAPSALAKAVEIFASAKTSEEIGSVVIEARHLLYISVALTIWIKSEVYIKNLLVKDIESIVIKKNATKVIKFSHQISIDEHLQIRPEITTALMEIMSTQARLGTEVVTVVYQVLLDILIGTSLIWNRYGALIGCEFLLFSALEILVLSHLVDYLTTNSEKLNKLNQAMYKFLNHENEIIQLEETVRMFGHEQFEIDSSKKYLEKYLNYMHKYQITENFASWIKLIPFVISNIIPVSFIMKDTISISDLDDFVFLMSYLNMFGGNILSLNQSIQSCLRAVKSINASKKFLVNSAFAKEELELVKICNVESPINGVEYPSPEISFDKVSFTYPNNTKPTLKNLTFIILPGKKIGIVGRSNAGKSTIVKLLYGIYKAQTGVIKINGHKIEEIPRHVLNRIFCCVPQKTDLFMNKSIKYNVLYGSTSNSILKKYSKREKRVNQEKILTENEPLLNNTDNLKMEEEGEFASTYQKTNRLFSQAMRKVRLEQLNNNDVTAKSSVYPLSGGQRQRLSFARALLRDSPVYVLDEATGSLDSFTEMEVLKNGKEAMKGKTVIMITHRLATVKDADEIIVLEDGAIVEKGAPSELFQNKGQYYNYWGAQMNC